MAVMQFERCVVRGGAILYDPRWSGNAPELLFDREHWRRQGRLQELHGVTLATYEQFARPEPPPHDQVLIFEWKLSPDHDPDARPSRRGEPGLLPGEA